MPGDGATCDANAESCDLTEMSNRGSPFAYSLSFPVKDALPRPSAFDLCGAVLDSEPYMLYMGPRFSGVPLHAHNASWNVLLTGMKKWYFIAPGQSYNATNSPLNGMLVKDWVTTRLPALRKQGLVAEVVQYPGDVVGVAAAVHAYCVFCATMM